MPKSNKRGFARIVAATVYSWQGFTATFRYEEAFRQEVLLLIFATPLALWKFDRGITEAGALAMGFVGGSTGETSNRPPTRSRPVTLTPSV